MISAYAIKHKANKAGVDTFIKKPFQLKAFLNAVETCIEIAHQEVYKGQSSK